jgi:hypothetical protein
MAFLALLMWDELLPFSAILMLLPFLGFMMKGRS